MKLASISGPDLVDQILYKISFFLNQD